jgi:UDP-2-acetamido-2,6-beta-L-arabino-hexul-4-ose reductase
VTRVLVTGARGFIGRNLATHLAGRDDVEAFLFDVDNDPTELDDYLARADLVFHLAGINRPENVEEFETGNAGFTEQICDALRRQGRAPKIVMASSIQAELDNPYGVSKRHAEAALVRFADETGAAVSIHRLKNVFGKWCRPNYNSVTATFCHNIAHDLPISIRDPDHEMELVYIDDVVECLLGELGVLTRSDSAYAPDTIPSHRITLGEMAGRIQAFHEMRTSLLTPDFKVRLNQCLYATYLSYVESPALEYGLDIRSDDRGDLAEFIKSRHFGQIFVSRTHPGVTRGNHYHHTKTEKFFVLAGEGLIRMRHIESDEVEEFRVRGGECRVVDIPSGFTH